MQDWDAEKNIRASISIWIEKKFTKMQSLPDECLYSEAQVSYEVQEASEERTGVPQEDNLISALWYIFFSFQHIATYDELGGFKFNLSHPY